MHVHVRLGLLDGLDNGEIGLAGVIRVYAPLQADLGRAFLPGLGDAPLDFRQGQVIAALAQVLGHAPLGKGAESATEIADIGVVDVPVDDVSDRIAVDLTAQFVGGLADLDLIGSACVEQACDLGFSQTVAGKRLIDDLCECAFIMLSRFCCTGTGWWVPGAQSSGRANPAASVFRNTRVCRAGSIQVIHRLNVVRVNRQARHQRFAG